MQIVADVTGKEISTPAITVGASFGDALMAASGIMKSPAKHLQIQCRMIFHSVSVEAFVLPAFFCFLKNLKKS